MKKKETMKELLNDLIRKSGLNNQKFAEAIGTSQSYLSQMKRQKAINHILLLEWMFALKIESIESTNVKIVLKCS